MGRCLGGVVGTKFHCRNSDRFIFGSNTCGVGYVREQHFSFLLAQTFKRRTHVK
ncbi:hypothetical protein [Leptospira weilii]|uniref:hypothetical protein n=1 Tax=Leptospira weilii TaxID=28184 RepID=UPI0012DAC06D|nr:hypothetical protein [Leptospira weilii]